MSVSLIIVSLVILYWLVRRMLWASRVNRIPGLPDCPIGIVGNMGLLRGLLDGGDPSLLVVHKALPVIEGLVMGMRDTGLVRVWMGPTPNFVISDADHVEAVLSSNELISKGFQYSLLYPWLGQGLLTSSGDKWRKNRKMLTPSFHFQILEQFVPIMSRNGNILVTKLEESAAKNNGIVPDLSPFILLCALDVICETAMGERINAQSDPDGKYIRAVHAIGDIIMDRGLKPWLASDFVFSFTQMARQQKEAINVLHSFTNSVIKSRMQEITKRRTSDLEARKKEPFMDALIREHIENPKDFTEVNIREEVDTFMFEGHDTTAWGVIWATYLLGLNPESQERVQDELDALFMDKQTDEDLTLEELRTGLAYTEAVVKEAQRLFPSVPLFHRKVTKDMRIKDYEIPAGSQVLVVPTIIQHNSKYWPEPQRFRPERFLSREKQHPYAFIPFSAGPRNCIGQKFAMLEEKALIAKIFRKFNVKSLDQRDTITPAATIILKSNIPIRLQLQVRELNNK